jgi:hypothetical protein
VSGNDWLLPGEIGYGGFRSVSGLDLSAILAYSLTALAAVAIFGLGLLLPLQIFAYRRNFGLFSQLLLPRILACSHS